MRSLVLTRTAQLVTPSFTTLSKPVTAFQLRRVYTSAMAHRDPSSLSNYDAWITRHTVADFKIDFPAQRLRGSVTLELESRTAAQSREIVLDASHLAVSAVRLDSQPADWHVRDRQAYLGSPLAVAVPDGVEQGRRVKVEIEVATTEKCTALQWLTPAQTSNGSAPFMFSQCQAIHARSLFPCQDTPDVKSTYEFRVRSPYVVVASGLAVEEDGAAVGEGEDKLYRFEQKVPIPSYLFALASGDIAMKRVGPISKVAAGPDEVESCKWEFEQDMDKFIQAAEKLVFPYKWGEYNVLVLPPSFPYGGMENPVFTFATPTVVSGDRQNVDVIAHELSHSWSGNLVTSCSWEHFWLNEGWTVYLERRIIASVRGKAHFDFSAVNGWKHLEDSIDEFGPESDLTKLCISHKGIDPDDAFSVVPYEKGFHMLWYLDRLVGRENFDKFIPYYFKKYSNKSLDSYEFKDTFLEFFDVPEYAGLKDKLAEIDWEGRFHKPGYPPKPEFDTSLIDVCFKLSEKWKSKDFAPSSKDIEGWVGNQTLVFLQEVLDHEETLTPERSQLLGKTYNLVDSQNVELKTVYYRIALRGKDTAAYQGVADLLGTVGRMKFVRPLFRALNKVDRDLAVKTFKKNKEFYHPICRAMVEKDLGLADEAKKV